MSRYALAQINATVGDLRGNAAKVIAFMEQEREFDADLVIFPELTLAGYPPEDLLLKPGFLDACQKTLDELATTITIPTLIGCPAMGNKGRLYNSAFMIKDNKVRAV